MLISRLEPDFRHEDGRGTLTQLVREGYKQVNVIFSKAEAFRGGHYHRLNTEAFYVVSGSFEFEAVPVADDGSGRVIGAAETHIFHAGDMFSVPAYVSHSFKYLDDTWLVSMYDRGVELPDGQMDTVVLAA